MEEFRDILMEQMCDYRSHHCKYPGDQFSRNTTRLSKKRRGDYRGRTIDYRAKKFSQAGRVTYEQYCEQKERTQRLRSSLHPRFCNEDLEDLKGHFHKFEALEHSVNCDVCGEKGAWWLCKLCGVKLHWKKSRRDSQTKLPCAVDYHNEDSFGLARCDCELVGRKIDNWTYPSAGGLKDNAHHINNLKTQYFINRLNLNPDM